MSYVVVCTAALLVAAMTLFSGFGLGTVLMPVFAIFFPVPIAIAATAIVHLANNIFKLALIGRWADYGVVLRFAVPAALAAVGGAALLVSVSDISPIYEYELVGRSCQVTVVKLLVAALIAGFTAFEFLPRFEKIGFDRRYIPLGGALSGFFGGLSGHQGALRTAFLVRAGLDKEPLLGTMAVSSVVVDVTRLVVYGLTFFGQHFAAMREEGGAGLVAAASLAAFVGSFFGARLVKKVTLATVHRIVGVLLLVMAVALAAGLV